MQPKKTLYFLDLNILIYIEKYNNNELNLKDDNLKENKENIEKLKELDNCNSIFTIITSALEGRSGDIEYNEEIMNNEVEKHYKNLSIFFKRAVIDKSIMKNPELNKLFIHAKKDIETIDTLKSKNDFLEDILPILKKLDENEKITCRQTLRDNILHIAQKYQLNEYSPMVMYSLYMIHTNNVKKIIKTDRKVNKKRVFGNYNSIMDFQHFHLFLASAAELNNKYIQKYCANIICKFLTNDKALNAFLENFDLDLIKSSSYQNDGISITIDFKNEDKWNKFINFFPSELADFYRERAKIHKQA